MAQHLRTIALASLATLGVAGTALFASSQAQAQAQAQAQYDNPSMGDTPCVVLSRYIGDEPTDMRTVGGARVHRAEVGVANICGRSVEVLLCVAYAEPVDGEDASCFAGMLRPWAATEIHTIEAATPLAGPTVEWRWVAGPSGAM